MSDQTNPGGGDFRGSASDKRKDETVMVNADDLSNLVSSARQDPAAPTDQPAPAYQPPAAAPIEVVGPRVPVALVAGILGVLALIVVVLLITFAL